MKRDPKARFSDRVEAYVKYRPGYPRGVIDWLKAHVGLHPGQVVADIGSGTGISSELFLRAGHPVIGVEPNEAMRAAARRLQDTYPAFRSQAGAAEATGLPSASVDWVVAGQAFHWFERHPAKTEFQRIGRPGAHLLLMWNERLVDTPFLEAYESLILAHATDYTQVDHRKISLEEVEAFFAPFEVTTAAFPNQQEMDFPGLKGRLLSSSYIPQVGMPGHQALMEGLRAVFDQHAVDGKVQILYDTQVYAGRLR